MTDWKVPHDYDCEYCTAVSLLTRGDFEHGPSWHALTKCCQPLSIAIQYGAIEVFNHKDHKPVKRLSLPFDKRHISTRELVAAIGHEYDFSDCEFRRTVHDDTSD
jgi:hypothetical protein